MNRKTGMHAFACGFRPNRLHYDAAAGQSRFGHAAFAVAWTLGLGGPLSLAAPVASAASDVVISQIYGGGGQSGSPFNADYVELFNRSQTPAALAGWSVQYASAGGNSWQVTPLSGTLQPGQYLLVQQAQGNQGGAPLPVPDVTGRIDLSATLGKVALVNSTAPLSCGNNCLPNPAIVDLVGYGAANSFEGASPAASLSKTLAAVRAEEGCRDTDSNGADFAAGPPAPRHGASPVKSCAAGTAGAASRIRDVQGRGHRSPLDGRAVSAIEGIVTAKTAKGFYLQDPSPDADDATSEGLFVFTSAAPAVNAGDRVSVSGTVSEFRPGGDGGRNNLTLTQIANPTVNVISSGNPLPPPVVIGSGGRIPPNRVIEDDAAGSVETSGSFDPASDGIDFYESLESMRVEVNHAVAVGSTNPQGEIPVIGDLGVSATIRSVRGGLVIGPDDFNPERIIIDNALAATPSVKVGDQFPLVQGILDYSFGNFKLLTTTPLTAVPAGLAPETTTPAAPNQLSVASFNVENLDPGDDARFQRLAEHVVTHLKAPDILGLMEMQDNNGAVNDGVVGAGQTFQALIAAIQAAGGPAYQFRSIDPLDDQDGGEPGGNIRVGFLFNPARVSFADRPGGSATAAVSVVNGPAGPELSASPGRIDPGNPAFANSRKPLAGEFVFQGRKLFVIANHFNSKGGDQPLFGHRQPPARSSEIQRKQQAQVVADFVRNLLTQDANAKVIALGDLNDFEFSEPLGILKNAGLVDLVENLPPAERYTYIFEGNSQMLDHILVSPALARETCIDYDIVHINAEFTDPASDHDPEVARFRF